MKKNNKKLKIVLLVFAGIILLLVGVYWYLASVSYNANRQIVYGVTFSKKFALQLGLDWQAAYLATLDDLKVKYLRIPTYWDELEPQKDIYNFEAIDWQLNEASKRNIKVVLVLGRRQPRWPECHDPVWVKGESPELVRQQLLSNFELLVNRYKNNNAVEIWQVENEPFLDFFGECTNKISKKQLQEEISLVKKLDDSRKVLITDSGELSTWYPAIKLGDLFGTTLYRTTYNKYFGFWNYFFIPPSYYRIKDYLWGRAQDTAYVAELQAEPWFPSDPLKTELVDHYKTMDAQKLQANAEYANKTNFSRAYFWGVEWWYWLKTAKGNDALWNTAKQYFK